MVRSVELAMAFIVDMMAGDVETIRGGEAIVEGKRQLLRLFKVELSPFTGNGYIISAMYNVQGWQDHVVIRSTGIST